jgi:hypothetical protein
VQNPSRLYEFPITSVFWKKQAKPGRSLLNPQFRRQNCCGIRRYLYACSAISWLPSFPRNVSCKSPLAEQTDFRNTLFAKRQPDEQDRPTPEGLLTVPSSVRCSSRVTCSHAALFQPHTFLGAIALTALLSDCNFFRLLFMLTWPVLGHDAFSCGACGAGSGVRLYTYLQDGARHHDGQKIPSARADNDPSTGQEVPSEGLGRTRTHSCVGMIPETRSSPSCPNKLAVRVLGRAEKTKGKIRLLAHPSSFGEMAPSNLHGYPRALSDNYNTHTCTAYHDVGPDRSEIRSNIQSWWTATSTRSIFRC